MAQVLTSTSKVQKIKRNQHVTNTIRLWRIRMMSHSLHQHVSRALCPTSRQAMDTQTAWSGASNVLTWPRFGIIKSDVSQLWMSSHFVQQNLASLNTFKSFCAAKSCKFKYIQDVSLVHWCLLSAISGGMFLFGGLFWQQDATRTGSKFDVLTPQNTAIRLANQSEKTLHCQLQKQLANSRFFSQRPHRWVRKLQGPTSPTPMISALCAALACTMAMEFPCI